MSEQLSVTSPSEATEVNPQNAGKGLSRAGWLWQLCSRLEGRLDQSVCDYLKVFIDIILMAAAALWSWMVVLGREVTAGNAAWFVLMTLVIRLPIYWLLGVWRNSWKQVSPQDVVQLGISAVAATPLFAALLYVPIYYRWQFLLPELARPSILLLTEPAFYLLFLSSVRILARMYQLAQDHGEERVPVLVVGAGPTGAALGYMLEQSGHEYTVAGYLDDDPRSRGRRVRGKPVLGRSARRGSGASARARRPSSSPRRPWDRSDCVRSWCGWSPPGCRFVRSRRCRKY